MSSNEANKLEGYSKYCSGKRKVLGNFRLEFSNGLPTGAIVVDEDDNPLPQDGPPCWTLHWTIEYATSPSIVREGK